MTTYDIKKTLLADWLYEKKRELEDKNKRRMSGTMFAVRCSVPQGSMSQYMRAVRLPGIENVDKMAAELGPEIYEIMDMPPRMPNDPILIEISKIYLDFDADKRQKLLEGAKYLRDH